MKKKLSVLLGFAVVIVLAIGMLGSGANWTSQTQAVGNEFQAATFGMTIGGTGTDTVSGACKFNNIAPGDDPMPCVITLHNAGSIPINVVYSGFQLTGDAIMADWLIVTDIADSNGETQMSDIPASFDSNNDGKFSLKEIAALLGNGYYAHPDGQDNYGSVFLAAGADGWVSMTLKFDPAAPNGTIGKMAGFNWTLTGVQRPKNP